MQHDTPRLHLVSALDFWESYLKAEGSSEGSIRQRLILLRALERRAGKPLAEITRLDLITDLGRTGLSASTRANYKSLYHTFFTWMQDEGLRPDNPGARLPRVRLAAVEANPTSTDDIQVLLNSGIYARTRMFVLIYAYQGFRAQEIAAVRGETIDWQNRRILSKDGKGGKEVWRPIHEIVWEELQKYPRRGFLFPSPYREGQHVTARNVSNVLGKAMRRAGIAHRPHQMRAWYATEMIDGGASTVVVAAAMRHADMQSIQHYVRVSDESIAAAHDLLPRVVVPSKSGRRRAA
ncbi:tyrosine-type recombinase/integrase [Herbiconiux sp. KACC 21604]|uniref:tyrosine-type recombinase/integrase n=1 Tax=unclassified Herbiconiux TaxID=2618217 RepID=UPI001492D702|nr:tyrosine-type recombinase/integrase [Herbiconiux sp. SALV-R1]QJU52912.1 tyrosine-type recombinase/integrase [Herbiconiux sp. SALV-R1]WPO87831.1 tyrosine-type recombinase/integrase [Herbiconiux sp. KACC 21604]